MRTRHRADGINVSFAVLVSSLVCILISLFLIFPFFAFPFSVKQSIRALEEKGNVLKFPHCLFTSMELKRELHQQCSNKNHQGFGHADEERKMLTLPSSEFPKHMQWVRGECAIVFASTDA